MGRITFTMFLIRAFQKKVQELNVADNNMNIVKHLLLLNFV